MQFMNSSQYDIDDVILGPLKKLMGKNYICEVTVNEQIHETLRESFIVNCIYEESEIIETMN